MNTDEFGKVMTVFFSKTTGKIKGVCQGDQPFSYFGEEEEDMKMILDKIVVEFNQKVLFNWGFYKVENGEITMSESMLKQFIL
ncbi:hypothetical protein P5F55_13655 [Clostridium perfringens]|uniref:hypothetical protein n=1 Tax=Clostridium perfringens TaxID=1502 RepID=UPI002973F58E|nr:hypothetical protein [Clostridium perfringens]MDK0834974.1 hypothetical protein [Clostridium perfringens]MDK0928406.1 hypothetical protein [Clostridium perfringens]MDM0495370.1 hypothetical protein [Clostridium perfringens]MDM0781084.1 hypothetical protein [Clostridium perfringens]